MVDLVLCHPRVVRDRLSAGVRLGDEHLCPEPLILEEHLPSSGVNVPLRLSNAVVDNPQLAVGLVSGTRNRGGEQVLGRLRRRELGRRVRPIRAVLVVGRDLGVDRGQRRLVLQSRRLLFRNHHVAEGLPEFIVGGFLIADRLQSAVQGLSILRLVRLRLRLGERETVDRSCDRPDPLGDETDRQ